MKILEGYRSPALLITKNADLFLDMSTQKSLFGQLITIPDESTLKSTSLFEEKAWFIHLVISDFYCDLIQIYEIISIINGMKSRSPSKAAQSAINE